MNMTVLFKKCTYGLLLIATTIIGLINFGYSSNVSDLVVNVDSFNGTIAGRSYHTIFHATSSNDYGTYCIKIKDFVSSNYSLTLGFNSSLSLATDQDWSYYIYTAWIGNYVCMYLDMDYLFVYNRDQNSSVTFSYDLFKLNTLLDTIIPVYSSQQCQTEYDLIPSSNFNSLNCQSEFNLIPLSSVDQNYCVNNGFCPSGGGDCPVGPGSGNNWSALYINNIQYNGAPTIRVTIPEEIERDNYTDEEETTIEIIGYGYDQEKMQKMVNTQYYKPTGEEMSGLIGKIADFLPLIAVALLITRLRRVIKKVF